MGQIDSLIARDDGVSVGQTCFGMGRSRPAKAHHKTITAISDNTNDMFMLRDDDECRTMFYVGARV